MEPLKTPDIEVRVTDYPDDDMALRAEVQGDGRTFTGYAAVFNADSEPLPFIERIAPGAFKRTLKNSPDIRAFVNHNADKVLGSTKAGTLSLAEDDRGLLSSINLPETTYAADLAAVVARGDVRGMSFGFKAVKDRWGEPGALWEPKPGQERMSQRLVTEARLFEVSVVTGFPAYSDTTAAVRHLAEALGLDDPDPLADAFAVLHDPEGRLTDEQRDLLHRAINARTDSRLVGPALSSWREKFASKGLTL